VDALRRENADLAAHSRAAVLSLYSLDSQLGRARSRLGSLAEQQQRLRAERSSITRQLGVARQAVSISQRRLAARVRVLYEHGDQSALEVVLGAENLDDALTQLDNVARFAALDEAVLEQVHVAKRRLTAAKAGLARRAERLAAARRDAEATAAALAAAKAERNAYLARLAAQRDLNAAQISRLEEQAQAAQARTRRLVPATAAAPEAVTQTADPTTSAEPAQPAAPVNVGARTITVQAVAYHLDGSTASGLPVGWGVVAVDPSVIPLGTQMTIPGYGEAVAADTGSAIVGGVIDLWMPSVEQAQAWGRRTVTVTIH
jgi:3D (Asp-Asp-Asp) domain-containing protein